MNLGKSIRSLRKNAGLSQKELASSANITQATLSKIENGTRPSPIVLKKISKVLKISESFIYAAGIEKEDVPIEKQGLYEQLFPVIENLIFQIGKNS